MEKHSIYLQIRSVPDQYNWYSLSPKECIERLPAVEKHQIKMSIYRTHSIHKEVGPAATTIPSSCCYLFPCQSHFWWQEGGTTYKWPHKTTKLNANFFFLSFLNWQSYSCMNNENIYYFFSLRIRGRRRRRETFSGNPLIAKLWAIATLLFWQPLSNSNIRLKRWQKE